MQQVTEEKMVIFENQQGFFYNIYIRDSLGNQTWQSQQISLSLGSLFLFSLMILFPTNLLPILQLLSINGSTVTSGRHWQENSPDCLPTNQRVYKNEGRLKLLFVIQYLFIANTPIIIPPLRRSQYNYIKASNVVYLSYLF